MTATASQIQHSDDMAAAANASEDDPIYRLGEHICDVEAERDKLRHLNGCLRMALGVETHEEALAEIQRLKETT